MAATLACSRGGVEPGAGLVPTALAGPSPNPSAPSGSPAPSAYFVVDPAYDTGTLFNVDGHLLAVYDALGWLNPGPMTGVAASVLAEPPGSTSLVFLGSGPDGECLVLRSSEAGRCLLPLSEPGGVAGSIPPGFVVVSDAIREEGGARHGVLSLVNPRASIALPSPVILDREIAGNEILVPIGALVNEGMVSAVYFAIGERGELTPGSLGGLLDLHLPEAQVSTVLDAATAFLGLSPDLRQAAFVAAGAGSPQVQVRMLEASTLVVFQPLAGGREVSRAVFSPQGSRLAWANRAADGNGPEILSISLASTFGGPTLQIGQAAVEAVAGGPVTDLAPAAWLTEDVLVLQATLNGEPHLLRTSADGSGLVHLGRGVFVGLVYP